MLAQPTRGPPLSFAWTTIERPRTVQKMNGKLITAWNSRPSAIRNFADKHVKHGCNSLPNIFYTTLKNLAICDIIIWLLKILYSDWLTSGP